MTDRAIPDYVPLTMEQIEAGVEEVIEANAVWPDPLPSQVTAVMDIVREAMAQAWDEGNKTVPGYYNPYALSPGSRCTCGAGDHRPPGLHNVHCADPDASAIDVTPPGADQGADR